MTDTARHLAPQQGKFRRALAGIWAIVQAMESGSSGYTFDRIEGLEREVRRLREEIRQIREPGPVDTHSDSAAGLDH
jgi:hypothetical protein